MTVITEPIHITFDQVVAGMTELMKEQPERYNQGCLYVHATYNDDGDTIVTDKPNCLIGATLIDKLGLPAGLFTETRNGASIYSVSRDFDYHGITFGKDAVEAMGAVQSWLDGQVNNHEKIEPWSAALPVLTDFLERRVTA